MGDTSTSQFIPASPSPALGDSLGKITCTRMKKNTLCLGHIKAFHEVKPSTTLTAWGGRGAAVIPVRPQDPPHKWKALLHAPEEMVGNGYQNRGDHLH